MERFGIEVPQHTCKRAQKLLKDWLEGEHEEAYGRLVKYIEEIKLANPGSVASCIHHGPSQFVFKRLFISFKAMISGFLRGCRSIISVDGTFLDGQCKGVLFVAMGLDANNGHFHFYMRLWTKNARIIGFISLEF